MRIRSSRFAILASAALLLVSCSAPKPFSGILPSSSSGSPSDAVPFDPATSDELSGSGQPVREAEYVSDTGTLAKFPAPKRFAIPAKELRLPVPENESKIYFGTGNADSVGPIFRPEFDLEVRLASDAQRVEIGWGGNYETEFLKDFQPWSGSFSYRISAKAGNLRSGTNRYLVRAYRSGDVVTERIFTLEYVNPSSFSTVSMRRTTEAAIARIEDGSDPVSASAYAKIDRDGAEVYRLALLPHEFGKQTLALGGHLSFVYELSKSGSLTDSGAVSDPESKFRPRFWIDDTGRASNAVEGVFLRAGQFSVPELRRYPNGRIVVATGDGHEGESFEYYYEPSSRRFFRTFEDAVVPATGSGAYPFYSVDPSGPDLVLREYAYCCDDVYNDRGNEYFTFDARSMALKSRTPVAPLKPGEWGKESAPASFENVRFRSEDWGYGLIAVTSSGAEVRYRVTNPEKIHEANAGKPFSDRTSTFRKTTGKLFSGKYYEIGTLE